MEKKKDEVTKEHFNAVKNIVGAHAQHLLEGLQRSIAILETRLSIAESTQDVKEVIYYNAALEQTKIFLLMLDSSVREVGEWCEISKKKLDKKGNSGKNSGKDKGKGKSK